MVIHRAKIDQNIHHMVRKKPDILSIKTKLFCLYERNIKNKLIIKYRMENNLNFSVLILNDMLLALK